NRVFMGVFSPDGRYLLTAGRDNQARYWDLRSGRLVAPALRHDDEVFTVALTPDGRWALTGSRDGEVRAWDPRTGRPVTPALRLDNAAQYLVVAADGRYAIAAIASGTALTAFCLGDLIDPDASSVDDLVALGELASGHRVYDGELVGLTTAEWLARWRAYHPHRRDSGATNPDDDLGRHWQESERLVRAERWSAAIPHLNALIQAQPEATLLARRGRAFAELGRWAEAAADLGAAVGADPDNGEFRYHHALALLVAGDTDGYRRARAAALEWYGRTTDPDDAYHVARACVLSPEALVAPDTPVHLAELTPAQGDKPWGNYVLGLACYRAGQFDRAVRNLQEAEASSWHARAVTWPVLAMAHHRLGHGQEAQRWMTRTLSLGEAWVSNAAWWDRADFRLLRREAQTLIPTERP
ncbi:MAG TPA: hypothetical protein VF590_10715, partial [Isosphaeraceae bacterium]